jgi:DNA processing protein
LHDAKVFAQQFTVYNYDRRGRGDLRNLCLRSVAIVGSRASTSYGEHVAAELAYDLAERSVVVVSGGAYGIDGAAHRAAHAAGSTVVVLACGPDVDYPRGHAGMFTDIARTGVLVSERPVGLKPTAKDFLVRNRLIAALTPGTVVVETVRQGNRAYPMLSPRPCSARKASSSVRSSPI